MAWEEVPGRMHLLDGLDWGVLWNVELKNLFCLNPDRSWGRRLIKLLCFLFTFVPFIYNKSSDSLTTSHYLNGTFYTYKRVPDLDHATVTSSQCESVGRYFPTHGNMTEAVWEEVICYEKDHNYGCMYLVTLWLPALFQYHILEGSGLDACLFFFVVFPFYPLLAFIVRVIGLFIPGDNWSKLVSRFALLEGDWEARLQIMMTLYVVFSRIDRGVSYFQVVGLALSMATLSLTGVYNARKKQTSLGWGGELRRGMYYLPSIFWKDVSRMTGISLLATLLQWWTLLLLLVMLLLGCAL